ncbi:MAG TPA: YkgJ family cysteine cluster protein [Acidimicrobiales bacterium]|nr:YkgJ family cysteine cluster protein [Acidimicrobiales bacterium]
MSRWVAETRRHLMERTTSPVACGTCTACCRSSQFVDIEPDEADPLAHIPARLVVQAPGRPAGHMVMVHDPKGCCPMLGEHGCTIYEHRPRACRTYDCRVFPATGIRPDQPLVAARAERWRFDDPEEGGRDTDDQVTARAERDGDGPDRGDQVTARAERHGGGPDREDQVTARALAAAAAYLTGHFPDSPALARAAAAVTICDAFTDPEAAATLQPEDVAALIVWRMSGERAPGAGPQREPAGRTSAAMADRTPLTNRPDSSVE